MKETSQVTPRAEHGLYGDLELLSGGARWWQWHAARERVGVPVLVALLKDLAVLVVGEVVGGPVLGGVVKAILPALPIATSPQSVNFTSG